MRPSASSARRALRSGSRANYVYTLNFTDEGVGKHDPENPEKGGDDILGDYIWFTVTVDDWIPTDQTPEL